MQILRDTGLDPPGRYENRGHVRDGKRTYVLLREGFDRARTQAKEARSAPGVDENRILMNALVDDVVNWMAI